MADEVLVERDDRVMTITINRPEARNAINAEVTAGVAAALDELEERAYLSLAILTGAGGNFSAGMDLKAFLRGENVTLPGRGLAGMTQAPPSKPVIAAVEGYALAGGCELVLSCDLVVASEEAKFGIPEVKRGLVAGAGGLLRLPNRIPYQVAMELALTGENFTAADAQRYGLANRITAPGEALAGARELAGKITANGPLAVRATKQIIVSSPDWTSDVAFDRQAEIMGPVFASADAQEGATAFAEKRAPVWRGE
jgi:enoyl-CoA hydratase